MTSLVDLDEFTSRLKLPAGSLNTDARTEFIITAASNIVRDEARQPNWVITPTTETEVAAPWRAKSIALELALRVWQDPGNVQRRTTGPISTSYFDPGDLRGMTLLPDEKEWLRGQRPGGEGGRMWVLGLNPSDEGRLPFGDETPDGYSFAAGDWDFAHGMSMGGPVDGDSW